MVTYSYLHLLKKEKIRWIENYFKDDNLFLEISDNDNKLFLLNQGHSGIYHCCTFCSSGGKKDVICACGGRMPGKNPFVHLFYIC